MLSPAALIFINIYELDFMGHLLKGGMTRMKRITIMCLGLTFLLTFTACADKNFEPGEARITEGVSENAVYENAVHENITYENVTREWKDSVQENGNTTQNGKGEAETETIAEETHIEQETHTVQTHTVEETSAYDATGTPDVNESEVSTLENAEQTQVVSQNTSEFRIKITVGNTEMTATLENNATTRAIVSQMPISLPMMDLYGREMCYRYGAYALPTDNMRSDNYEVGDIVYWAPGGSLVILYGQNGEKFERQQLGHIDSGVEVFKNTGDTTVTFELIEMH